jgi:hypothetical protein
VERLREILRVLVINLANAKEGFAENLEANLGKFIHRCFWIGVDVFAGGWVLSSFLFWALNVNWQGTRLVYPIVGAMLGAFCYGIAEMGAICIYSLVPAKANIFEEKQKGLNFQTKTERRALRKIKDVIRLFQISAVIILLGGLACIFGWISPEGFGMATIILIPATFVVSGAYFFINYIISGIMPTKSEMKAIFKKIEAYTSSKGT